MKYKGVKIGLRHTGTNLIYPRWNKIIRHINKTDIIIALLCLVLAGFMIIPAGGADAAGHDIKSCAALQAYMQQSNYKTLPNSAYSAQFRIKGEIRDTIVTRYLTKEGGLIAIYAVPGGPEYAFGYSAEEKKPVSIYCKTASGAGKVLSKEFLSSTAATSQPSGSASTSWYKLRKFDFSVPATGLPLLRWNSNSGPISTNNSSNIPYWPYFIGLLGFFVAGGIILSALGGASSGGALPNGSWLLIISLIASVIFVMVSNYFGTQRAYSHLQGPLTWIMIILAAIMVFICGVFARRIWFSLLQSLLMWFIMEFGDALFEFHRIGAAMAQSFINGNLDPLVYMTFSAAAAYGVFIGVINKFKSVNTDLKSVFVN